MNNQLLVRRLKLLSSLFLQNEIMKCQSRNFLWSFAQFMFYFPIICYKIHVKLVHISVYWIETIIYRMILNEMFVCTFSIHARMFKFCQNVCNDNLWSYAHVKIWRNIIDACFVVWFFSNVSTCSNSDETFVRFICFAIFDRCLRKNIEMLCLIHACFVISISFVCFSSNEMFFHLIVISLSICALSKDYTEILTRCLQRF